MAVHGFRLMIYPNSTIMRHLSYKSKKLRLLFLVALGFH